MRERWLNCVMIWCRCVSWLLFAYLTQAQMAVNSLRGEKHTANGIIMESSMRRAGQPFRQQLEAPNPVQAANYMDDLLKDYDAARKILLGDFTKRSRIAVVYMCFERAEVIRRSLPAVMRSDGVEKFDLYISQDAGSGYVINKDLHFPESVRIAYIRHRANLCTGLHHHFVKAFAFDIMGYEGVIIVEEDNVVHPQALQLLARMIDLSVNQPDIGIVSLLDMDNSAFLDAAKFAVGINPVNGSMGHLWVYGFHKSRYTAVRQDLYDYFNTIKGQDYRLKHEPPLSDKIKALMASKGFPADGELSQDRYFIYSLAKRGFKRRYQTLFRFFEPIGYLGLHHRHTEAQFFAVFGRGMFNGRIRPEDAFDVTKDPANPELIKAGLRERINRIWRRYFSIDVHEPLVEETFTGIMEGRLNGVEAMTDIRNAGVKATAG